MRWDSGPRGHAGAGAWTEPARDPGKSKSVSRSGAVLMSCGADVLAVGTMTLKTSVKDLIAEARATIDNLPADQMAKALQAKDVLLVDLREPAERAEHGTIPGALAAPRGMLEFYADPATPYHKKEFEPSRHVLLYCASGGRSALAGASLKRLGYPRVSHLDGGFKAWKEAGQPTGPGR